MIQRGVPAIHRVSGHPAVDIFVDEGAHRIGLRTPCLQGTEAPESPVAAISTDVIQLEGERYIEVWTREERLYSEFYSFCVSLADRVQIDHQDVERALAITLTNWRALLEPASTLSLERQLGLVGEMWLLGRLIDALGVDSVAAWTGPLGEPHDFRLSGIEIEVKVTLSPTRSHIISGENQLVPSPGHDLWLLSLQLEPGGASGTDLPTIVDQVRTRLQDHTAPLSRFQEDLQRIGYQEADRRRYQERWGFRKNPHLIPVDAACPRITRDALEAMLPTTHQRISDVHYRINVEGLGFDDAAQEYQQVLPIGRGDLSLAV
jgi:hypothetical protein